VSIQPLVTVTLLVAVTLVIYQDNPIIVGWSAGRAWKKGVPYVTVYVSARFNGINIIYKCGRHRRPWVW
jgi:hypothetical protein